MDDKGFIFTVDAALALIVVMTITVSITAYTLIPFYQGEDHQHLEAIADSALAVMEQDGTLANAAVQAEKDGNPTVAQGIINDRLKVLIPAGVSYKLTMTVNSSLAVKAENDSSGSSVSTDQVTKVKVISAPKEGWMGRAWYKIENFTFEEEPQNVTTTLWNFHNWLTNFPPWQPGNYNSRYGYYTTNGLINDPYWGKGTTAQNIHFSVPAGITLNNVKFLIGSSNKYNGNAFGANVTLNGAIYPSYTNNYTFLDNRPGTSGSSTQKMYNYQGLFNKTNFAIGKINNFTVKFWNMTGPTNQYTERYDLPWFSIIANYTTSFLVPKGILSSTYYFPDAGGLAVQDAQDLDGNGVKNEYGRIYNLNTGSVTSFTNKRVIDWDDMYNKNSNTAPFTFDDGTPFVITGASGDYGTRVTSTKTAVSIVKDVPIPGNGNRVLDSFVVVNAYGGVDGGLVEVWNGTVWRTIFNSYDIGGVDYSAFKGDSSTSAGYGNIPGIVYIPSEYLVPGANNKVRITVWDDVPGNDYDLVGLTNCYVTSMYSALNVRWDDVPYDSYQNNTNVASQTKTFTIGGDAKLAYLFVGTGMDSGNITVKYSNTSKVLYSGPIPYYLNLAALDAKGGDPVSVPGGFHYITSANSTEDNYNLTTGTYSLTVTVNSSSNEWESGDPDAEIFSGTRIGVIYPEILVNAWAIAYSNNASDAETQAKIQLNGKTGVDMDLMSSDALYTGDMPNQIPVRLDLWKQ
jgi:hypothetical protein